MFWFPDIPPGQEKQFQDGLVATSLLSLLIVILLLVVVYVLWGLS